MSPHDAPILFERAGAVATIRFNRPAALNAISLPMAEAFLGIVRTISGTPDIRVVVLCGEGNAFMAGGDISLLHADLPAAPRTALALLEPLNAALEILTGLPQLVIGSLHGSVVGAGFSVAMACDLLIAAGNTRFNLAFARIGASPDASATWSLPRAVGLHKALALALLADTFDAAEAQRLGIVSRVVPLDALGNETAMLAQRLAAGPGVAFGKTKQLMRASFAHSQKEQMAAECAAIAACTATDDFAEGITAFFSKRKPNYTGR